MPRLVVDDGHQPAGAPDLRPEQFLHARPGHHRQCCVDAGEEAGEQDQQARDDEQYEVRGGHRAAPSSRRLARHDRSTVACTPNISRSSSASPWS